MLLSLDFIYILASNIYMGSYFHLAEVRVGKTGVPGEKTTGISFTESYNKLQFNLNRPGPLGTFFLSTGKI